MTRRKKKAYKPGKDRYRAAWDKKAPAAVRPFGPVRRGSPEWVDGFRFRHHLRGSDLRYLIFNWRKSKVAERDDNATETMEKNYILFARILVYLKDFRDMPAIKEHIARSLDWQPGKIEVLRLYLEKARHTYLRYDPPRGAR